MKTTQRQPWVCIDLDLLESLLYWLDINFVEWLMFITQFLDDIADKLIFGVHCFRYLLQRAAQLTFTMCKYCVERHSLCPLEMHLTLWARNLPLSVEGGLWASDVVRNFCGHCD